MRLLKVRLLKSEAVDERGCGRARLKKDEIEEGRG